MTTLISNNAFDKKSQYKVKFNQKISPFIEQRCIDFNQRPNEFGNIGILDSVFMRTMNYLLSMGVKPLQISSFERNPELHRFHRANGIWSYETDLTHFMEHCKYQEHPWGMMIMDANGTFKKLSSCYLNMFKKGFIGDGTILVITVSRRNGGNFKNAYDTFKLSMNKELRKLGLYVAKNHDYKYGEPRNGQSCMFSGYFYFRKIKAIRQSKKTASRLIIRKKLGQNKYKKSCQINKPKLKVFCKKCRSFVGHYYYYNGHKMSKKHINN